MIDTNRPVIGYDLQDLKLALGLSSADAGWIFGMSPTKWTHIAKQGNNDPVKDPSLALLVRFLDRYPHIRIIPDMPTAQDMFDTFNSIAPCDMKRMSILVGSESSGGSRWLTKGTHQPPTLQHLFFCLIRLFMEAKSDKERETLLADWIEIVTAEGYLRTGDHNILKSGRWTPKNQASTEAEKQ